MFLDKGEISCSNDNYHGKPSVLTTEYLTQFNIIVILPAIRECGQGQVPTHVRVRLLTSATNAR